jgi:hypothetical protein
LFCLTANALSIKKIPSSSSSSFNSTTSAHSTT